MSISNIAFSTDKTITIGGSGSDRVVVAAISQGRNPTSLTNINFDGVAGTEVASYDTGGSIAAIYIWKDADLPPTSGTYTLTHSFLLQASLVYAEGVDQVNTVVDTKNLSDMQEGPVNITHPERFVTIPTATIGDLLVHSARLFSATDGAISGCTDISGGQSGHAATYTTTQTKIGHGEDANPFAFIAAAFKSAAAAPSYTITSIDGDNDVQAGQSNVDIVMTATTGVTSVTLGGETLTINGVS